eukprot:767512-Hanusia_phi.AAC.2
MSGKSRQGLGRSKRACGRRSVGAQREGDSGSRVGDEREGTENGQRGGGGLGREAFGAPEEKRRQTESNLAPSCISGACPLAVNPADRGSPVSYTDDIRESHGTRDTRWGEI